VQEYAKDKRFIEFSGVPPTPHRTLQDELNYFMGQFAHHFEGIPFTVTNWLDAFRHVSDRLTDEQTVIFLDEISWMGSKDPSFIGKLKVWWDTVISKRSNVQVILCGSVSTWIEENIIKSTALFGRISLTITLKELSFFESLDFLRQWGIKGSPLELLSLLSVTGGIPWYLEQLSPHLLANDNIKRLCFIPEGLLFNEFDRIFNDLFEQKNTVYMKIIIALSGGLQTLSELREALGYQHGGTLSRYLDDLQIAGFVTEHPNWSFKTGKQGKQSLYRLSDSYLRFYVKYIMPQRDKIQQGIFRESSLSDLLGWESIIGYQLENLLLNNRPLLLKHLGILPHQVVADNPYYQQATKVKRGCQIDYLVQTTGNTLILCEFKFQKREIQSDVIDAVKEKMNRLSIPRQCGIAPVLIHLNGVARAVQESNFFYRIIDVQDWMV
jgi:AAA+ ATPase superfamily predicted ATPase